MYNQNMELTPQEEYEQSKKQFVKDFESDPTKQIETQEKEEIEKHRVRLRREAGIIFDEALRYFKDLERISQEKVEDSIKVGLVQLPETKAIEITERIEEAERQFSPGATEEGYESGSATEPDELLVRQGEAPVLLTAEHATQHIRSAAPKEADWGTGGLMTVLATDHGTFAIAPLGMQTGDANHEGDHPIKTESGIIIVQKGMRLALSIHGIGPSKYITPEQMEAGRNSDIAVGIGDNPTEESMEFAHWLQEEARDLELRADINPWYMSLAAGQPKVKDNLPLRVSFRAAKAHTTRSHMQETATQSGLILPIAQIELASALRVQPGRESSFEKVYKAYVLLSEAIERYKED